MRKKILSLIITALLSPKLFAHDEGHGPKLGDQAKFGGVIAAVISASEVEKGRKADLIYKAELTKNSDGIVRLYFYDIEMKAVSSKQFKNARGKLARETRATNLRAEPPLGTFLRGRLMRQNGSV